MHFVLSPENTLFLDRLVKTTSSEFITFDWDSLLEIQLTAPDLSQLTVIKLQPTFFEEFQEGSGSIGTASIPMAKLYQSHMKSLKISIVPEASRVTMEYTYADIKHIKTSNCLAVDMFDLEFATKKCFDVDLSGLGRILSKGTLEVSIGRSFVVRGEMVKICVDDFSECQEEICFRIEAERLKSILSVADRFYESSLCFSEDLSPLNVVFKTPEIHYSTFISVE